MESGGRARRRRAKLVSLRGYNRGMIRVEHVLDSWKAIREDTAQAVADFPGDDLDFRATTEVMKFRDIARHVLVASDGLAGMLLSGEENFSGPEMRDKIAKNSQPVAADLDAATLAAALRESLARRAAELAQKDAAFYASMVTRMDGAQVTRLEMVQYIKEHELTHRSQMFMYLRLKGVTPSTTRRRQAKQAAK